MRAKAPSTPGDVTLAQIQQLKTGSSPNAMYAADGAPLSGRAMVPLVAPERLAKFSDAQFLIRRTEEHILNAPHTVVEPG